MGLMFRLIIVVAIAILSLYEESDAYSSYNVSIQRQPQKTLEIIEVMLPQNTESPDHSRDNMKEFQSQGEPRYEIYIKPTKNRQTSAGGRKIKIFVESEEYSNEKESSKNSSRVVSNQQNYQPMPLAIQTAGLNIDTFQHSRPAKENSTGNVRAVKYGNEYTYKPNNASFIIQKSESKSVHNLRDIPEQVTVYGDDYISQKNEDREKRNKFRSNSERGSASNIKPSGELRTSYVPVTVYKNDSPQISRSVQREQSTHNPYIGVTERHFRESSFNNEPSHNRDVGVEKVLVFEPNAGISVTKVNLSHTDRGHTQTIRSTHDFDYGRTKAQSNTDEERTDHSFIARNPGRNQEQSPYHEEDNRYSNSEYSRGSTAHSLSNGRGISEERYPSDRKTIYGSRDPYAEETYDTDIPTTRSPFEIAHENAQSSLGTRPVRQNGYGGFPENYSPHTEQFSRPSRLGGSNSDATSPCPNVFQYTSFESDRWYAEIFVRTDEVLVGMRLDIILDGRADLMTSSSTQVKSHDNIRFTVLSLKKTLVPGKPDRVDIMVKFSLSRSSPKIPYIKTIDLNGRMICPSRINSYTQVTTTRRPVHVYPSDVQEPKRTTERNPYNRPAVINEYPSGTRRTTSKPIISTKKTTPPTDYAPAPNPNYHEQSNHNRITTSKPTPNRPFFTNNKPSTEIHGINPVSNSANDNLRPNDREKRKIPCGKPAIQPRPLITSGQMTTRGQWPWHVALYRNTVPNLTYICGGSLVSENHIITAAHCATKEHTSIPLDPNMLLVYLGKYNLLAWTEHGGLSRDVARITVHPDFNVTNFRADIAVLTLSQRVEYTDFIRPVCLWDKRSTHIDDIVGLEGTVVGWGYDETKQLTEELKQAKMPVVAQNVCLWSYPDFFPKFTHNNTYCAGFKNGTSVCNGDSGGGMFFPIKINREERWFLRGLVSLSASEKTDKVCDITHYVIFADTAKYLPWLEDVLSRI